MLAPWAANWASLIALPSPAPPCTRTSWPRSASSRTPAGVIAVLYWSVLISVGTPILICVALLSMAKDSARCAGAPDRSSPCQLPAAQREPELDAVPCIGEVASGELLDAADPVAQSVAGAEQRAPRPFPMALVVPQYVEGSHQPPPPLPPPPFLPAPPPPARLAEAPPLRGRAH